MPTYAFNKEDEGFSLTIGDSEPISYINALIAKSETSTTLAIRMENEVYVFKPASDEITINGVEFSGTPAELWAALNSEVFDEQQGGGLEDGSVTDVKLSAATKERMDQRGPDYVIYQSGSNYKAISRGSLTEYTNTDFYTVANSAKNQLTPAGTQGSSGGWLHIGVVGEIAMSDELVITGWEAGNPPFSQLMITGNGYATKLMQNTAGKNAIVVKNRASVVIRDLFIGVGAGALSGILGDDNGADHERSIWDGELTNIRIQSAGSAPALHLKNYFNLHGTFLDIESDNHHGTLLENTTGEATNYGNSVFTFLSTRGSTSSPYAGLAIISNAPTHPQNLQTFSALFIGRGYYGLYGQGASYSVFINPDIEYVGRNVRWEDGVSGINCVGNTFVGGYLYTNAGGTAIYSDTNSSSNVYINTRINSDDNTLTVIDDLSVFQAANKYDITTDWAIGASPTINIASPATTELTVRKVADGLTIKQGPYVTPTLTALTQNVVPSTGNSRDLGSSSNYWANVYAQNVRANFILARSGSLQLSSSATNQSVDVCLNNTGQTVGRFFGTTGNLALQQTGPYTDIPSARLALNSTSQGFLPPRMTEAQKNAISSPAEGLMIYQTDGTKGWYGYNGSAWVALN